MGYGHSCKMKNAIADSVDLACRIRHLTLTNGSPEISYRSKPIPITPMIRRVLDTLPSTGKFVLNGKDRPFGDHSGAKEKVDPAIRSWTLHDLRRSFASGLQRLGIAPHIVELALNHHSGTFSGVAGIYQGHRYAKEVREAFEAWSQYIEVLTSEKM